MRLTVKSGLNKREPVGGRQGPRRIFHTTRHSVVLLARKKAKDTEEEPNGAVDEGEEYVRGTKRESSHCLCSG